jgi:hypothetical protein
MNAVRPYPSVENAGSFPRGGTVADVLTDAPTSTGTSL